MSGINTFLAEKEWEREVGCVCASLVVTLTETTLGFKKRYTLVQVFAQGRVESPCFCYVSMADLNPQSPPAQHIQWVHRHVR